MKLNILGTYRLSVVDVIHYDNGLVELIGDDGITVSEENVREMFDFIATLEPRPQIALTNRRHHYSFSFDAIRFIQQYRGIKALAIVVYSRLSYLAAEFARSGHFKIRIFMDRDDAINWLSAVLKEDAE